MLNSSCSQLALNHGFLAITKVEPFNFFEHKNKKTKNSEIDYIIFLDFAHLLLRIWSHIIYF